MDWFTQAVFFLQEWGWLMALLFLVLGAMCADLFPRVYAFIADIESKYPQLQAQLFTKEKELIDRYEYLPVRIRSGFAMVGGKEAWSWLVTRMYRYLRERTWKSQEKNEHKI